ncbi:MAG: cupredoxin domain-containing protein [Candidatus Moraniibacteriota bacterium]
MKKNIMTVIAVIVFGIVAIGAGMYLGVISNGTSSKSSQKIVGKTPEVNADGKQIIEIAVKGGYSPKSITATAGMPTVLRFVTDNTFDCSSSLSIPAINYRKNLPRTGTTDVDVPAQTAGTTLRGSCSMGMYSFTVNFE